MSPQTSPGEKCTTALKKWSIGSPGGGPFSGPAEFPAHICAHSAKPRFPESAHSRNPRFPRFPDFPDREKLEKRASKRASKRGPKSAIFDTIPKISQNLAKPRKYRKTRQNHRKTGQTPVQRNDFYPNIGGAPFQILKLYKGYRTQKVENIKREDSRTGCAPPILPRRCTCDERPTACVPL